VESRILGLSEDIHGHTKQRANSMGNILEWLKGKRQAIEVDDLVSKVTELFESRQIGHDDATRDAVKDLHDRHS